MKRPHLPKKSLFPYFALLLAVGIWGGALPVIKITLDYIPPFSFLFLRFLLVAIVMLPVIFIETKKTPIHKKDIKNLILLGVFGQASIGFIFWGMKYATAIDTALISTTAPLMTIFAGHHFYKEKVGKMTKFGIAIATLGTAFIVFEPILESSAGIIAGGNICLRLFGNLLVVLYNVNFTIYVLFSKVTMGKLTKEVRSALRHFHVRPMKRIYSPTLTIGVTFYVGLAAIMPFSIAENFAAISSERFCDTSIFFLNLSILPSVSMYFCLPVYSGWHLLQISTRMLSTVDCVTKELPHAHVTVTSLFICGCMSFFIYVMAHYVAPSNP